MKQKNQIKQCSCRTWLVILVSVVVTAVMVGSGVFFVMSEVMEKEKGQVAKNASGEIPQKAENSEKIEDLNKKLKQLQRQSQDKDNLLESEKEKITFSQEMLLYIKDRNIFRDNNNNISLTTPENWRISPNPLEKDADVLSFSIVPDEPKNCGKLNNKNTCLDKINFGITQNTNRLDFKEYLKKVRNHSDQFMKDFEELDFKGKKAYKFVNINAYDGTENTSLWVQLDNRILFYISESYLKKEQKEDFDQIISNITL